VYIARFGVFAMYVRTELIHVHSSRRWTVRSSDKSTIKSVRWFFHVQLKLLLCKIKWSKWPLGYKAWDQCRCTSEKVIR